MAIKLTQSYYNAGNRYPIMHTIPELMDIRGTQHPEKEAVVIREIDKPRQVITFGELKTKTEQLAAGMIKKGLKKGDTVGLFCPTSLDYAVCEYALARTGAILMSFDGNVKNFKYKLRKSNSRWLIAHPGADGKNYNILRIILPSLVHHDPSSKLTAHDLPDLEAIFIMSSASFPGTIPWSALFCEIEDADLHLLHQREATISVDDIREFIATSGSTGDSKLVVRKHSHGTNASRSALLVERIDETDRLILNLPMSYMAELTPQIFGIGFTIVFSAADTDHDKGKELFFKVIEEENCSALYVCSAFLPSLIQQVDSGKFDISGVKVGFIGNDIVHRNVLDQALKRLPCIVVVYGTTEAGFSLGDWLIHSLEQRLNYTGLGYEGEFKIVDEQGVIVAVNTPGELCVRNQFLFLKYWGDEEKTKQQKDDLGWYKTGDMAVMNEDGFVKILGRRESVIPSATIKIYPVNVEDEVLQHPQVAHAVAVGIPHEVLQEEVCVCVVPKPKISLTVEEIRQYCEETFLVSDVGKRPLLPDYILIFQTFPIGSTGKIDRKKIRELAIDCLAK
jgi:fatty-acyl-CoA synthase